jgi:PBP1b-binding outer membrane lipoprotein LpoB
MYRKIYILVICVFLLLTGCATREMAKEDKFDYSPYIGKLGRKKL